VKRSGQHLSARGFTLVELMLAMAMIAVVIVPLYASLQKAFTAKREAEAILEPPRSAEIAMEFMRSDIQNALAPSGVLAGNFEGTQAQDAQGHEGDDLIFYTTADATDHVDGNGDIKEVELTTEPSADGKDTVLVRRVTRNLLSQTQVTPDEEILCRGVSSLTLQYYTGSEWVNTWDSTQEDSTVPAAVQVTLELQRTDTVGRVRTSSYTRIFPISCSTAAEDPAVNSGVSMP
jgi:type II secretion system protein J